MKNLKTVFLFLLIVLIGVALLLCRSAVADAVGDSLTLCGEILIPSMFPFMALSCFAVNSGAFEKAERIFSPVMRLFFKLPGECFGAVFFGFIGGYPVGAGMIAALYEKGQITEKEVRQMFSFCINAGPAFMVSAVGGMMLGSEKAGWVMLASVCLSSLLVGSIGARLMKKENRLPFAGNHTHLPVSAALTDAVSSSTRSVLSVCSWVLLFAALSALVRPHIPSQMGQLLFDAFTEVTSGVSSAVKLGGIPFGAAVISFGGLSVLFQLLPTMKKCGIKASEYLVFRIVNMMLTFLLSKFLLCFIAVDVSASAFAEPVFWSYSAPASAALLVMGAALIVHLNQNFQCRSDSSAAAF